MTAVELPTPPTVQPGHTAPGVDDVQGYLLALQGFLSGEMERLELRIRESRKARGEPLGTDVDINTIFDGVSVPPELLRLTKIPMREVLVAAPSSSAPTTPTATELPPAVTAEKKEQAAPAPGEQRKEEQPSTPASPDKQQPQPTEPPAVEQKSEPSSPSKPPPGPQSPPGSPQQPSSPTAGSPKSASQPSSSPPSPSRTDSQHSSSPLQRQPSGNALLPEAAKQGVLTNWGKKRFLRGFDDHFVVVNDNGISWYKSERDYKSGKAVDSIPFYVITMNSRASKFKTAAVCWPLITTQECPKATDKRKTYFGVQYTEPKDNKLEFLVFGANSPQERDEWVYALTKYVKLYLAPAAEFIEFENMKVGAENPLHQSGVLDGEAPR